MPATKGKKQHVGIQTQTCDMKPQRLTLSNTVPHPTDDTNTKTRVAHLTASRTVGCALTPDVSARAKGTLQLSDGVRQADFRGWAGLFASHASFCCQQDRIPSMSALLMYV